MSRFHRSRTVWIIVGSCGLIGGIITLSRKPPTILPQSPNQIAAKNSFERAKVVVGPNRHVSAENASSWQREVLIATDPSNADRLFATAILAPQANSQGQEVVAYRSDDGGMTWHQSFRQGRSGEAYCDVALAHAGDGTIYVAFAKHILPAPPPGEISHPTFQFVRSMDSGNSWESVNEIQESQGALDRPYLTVDQTSGSFRGRLYCASTKYLHSSSDRGKSFIDRTYSVHYQNVVPMPSNPVVLKDGTVIFGHRDWRQGLDECPGLSFLASKDGGKTLKPMGSTVHWRGEKTKIGFYWFLPQLAVDTSTGPSRDRIYAVWDDGNGPLRVRILFAYSIDQGQSWIGPIILSEQSDEDSSGYAASMPSIAVNKNGVVAVSWFDRRGLPDLRGHRSPDYGSGGNIRLRVSLDGASTWQASVQINESTIDASVFELRDNAGLAADSNGNFHAVWCDDRTGILQVWTSKVTVTRE